LGPTGVVIYLGWTLGNGTDVRTSGYAAMAFGVIFRSLSDSASWRFSFTVAGYDEPSVLIAPEHDAMESKDVPEAK
jgi:hypothetical protein